MNICAAFVLMPTLRPQHLVRLTRLILMPVAVALVAAVLCLSCGSPSLASPPVKRIGYLEAGPFWLFDNTWNAFRDGMGKYDDLRYGHPGRCPPEPRLATRADAPPAGTGKTAFCKRKDLDLCGGHGHGSRKGPACSQRWPHAPFWVWAWLTPLPLVWLKAQKTLA